MIEVLSVAPLDGGSRVNWALPASVELQRDGWRLYATGGYFSRGAMFGSGAVEIELSERTWVEWHDQPLVLAPHDDLSAALGLKKARTDVNGGLTFAVGRTSRSTPASDARYRRATQQHDPHVQRRRVAGVQVGFDRRGFVLAHARLPSPLRRRGEHLVEPLHDEARKSASAPTLTPVPDARSPIP